MNSKPSDSVAILSTLIAAVVVVKDWTVFSMDAISPFFILDFYFLALNDSTPRLTNIEILLLSGFKFCI